VDADDLQPEEELSEEQLREIYDNEEVERFINLFSAVRSQTLFLLVFR
jgi:hypothetical protein